MVGAEKDKLIVALDVNDLGKLRNLVQELSPYVGCFKVGLEVLTSLGAPRVVGEVHDAGGRVFLDGKFCDIPNTVAKAAREVSKLGVAIFNVHACCGMESLQAAAKEKGKAKLLAVTVLTSMSDATCRHIFGRSPAEAVHSFARDAKEAGADGVICSPQELDLLCQNREFEDLAKITPGVRPVWAAKNDQERVMTPKEALQKGATALVIGRPITDPPSEIGSPQEAVLRILEEIS